MAVIGLLRWYAANAITCAATAHKSWCRGIYSTLGIQLLSKQRDRIEAQWIRVTIQPLRRSASCLTVARRTDSLPGNWIIGF
jgi:hypothetical protein